MDFSFIDISVERVTGLENDSDEAIWINLEIKPSFCVTLIDLNRWTMNTEHE